MMSGQGGGMMSGQGGGMMSGPGGGMMSGQGGAGGQGMCLTCSQFALQCVQMMQGCPSESLLCSASLAIYTPLKTCVCNQCSGQCALTCTNMGTNAPGCSGCVQLAALGTCSSQYGACQQD
jgi:hypothetical protein